MNIIKEIMDCYDSNRFTIEMKQNFTVEASKILDNYIDERVKSLLPASSLQLKEKRKTNSQKWEEISIEELKERIRK